MPIKLDLVTRRFGKLLVVSLAEKTKKHTIWNCLCDCGNMTRTRSGNLLSGKSKSCGCGDKQRKRDLALRLKESNKKDPIEVAKVYIYNDYVSSARKRGLEITLNKDEVFCISNLCCYYCGQPPSNIYKVIRSDEKIPIKYGGLDRIDSSKGYTKENVVPCCKKCNRAKSDMSSLEFRQWILSVYKNINNI